MKLDALQKQWEHTPHVLAPQSCLLSIIFSNVYSYFELVVVWAIVSWRPLSPRCFMFFSPFPPFKLLTDLMVQRPPPGHFTPACASSLLSVGLLLCLPFKFWPLKANAPFPLYFLVSCFAPTNGGTPKPGGKCLAWDHMK